MVLTMTRGDSLEAPYRLVANGDSIPLAWVVKWTRDGEDPLHRAWMNSRDGKVMSQFITTTLRLRVETSVMSPNAELEKKHRNLRKEYIKRLAIEMGVSVWSVEDEGINFAALVAGKAKSTAESARMAADAMRRTFSLDEIVTLRELMALMNARHASSP